MILRRDRRVVEQVARPSIRQCAIEPRRQSSAGPDAPEQLKLSQRHHDRRHGIENRVDIEPVFAIQVGNVARLPEAVDA